jgi:hypothetical protein
MVEFDLPPPDLGKETGSLSPRIDWYVIDTRMPLRQVYQHQSDVSVAAEAKLQARVGEVVKEARLDGIRPMPIERLLAYLGYDMNTPIIGRAEAVDNTALMRLIAPRRTVEAPAKPAAADTMKAERKADQPKAEEMKDEAGEDQPKPRAKSKLRGKAAAKKKKQAEGEDNDSGGAEPKE